MVKQVSSKGFTLIEMCLVLMIISFLSFVTPSQYFIAPDVKGTMNEIISVQYRAFETHEKQGIDLPRFNQSIQFNAEGNITQATRIELSKKVKLTLMLATGRIFVRRIESD